MATIFLGGLVRVKLNTQVRACTTLELQTSPRLMDLPPGHHHSPPFLVLDLLATIKASSIGFCDGAWGGPGRRSEATQPYSSSYHT